MMTVSRVQFNAHKKLTRAVMRVNGYSPKQFSRSEVRDFCREIIAGQRQVDQKGEVNIPWDLAAYISERLNPTTGVLAFFGMVSILRGDYPFIVSWEFLRRVSLTAEQVESAIQDLRATVPGFLSVAYKRSDGQYMLEFDFDRMPSEPVRRRP